MSGIFLSIIIPTICDDFSFQRLIERSIVICDEETEIIIVDQVRNRESQVEVLADCNVRVFASDVLGLSQNRNIGIGLASGEWLMFLDDDAILVNLHVSRRVLRGSLSECVMGLVVDEDLKVTSYSKTRFDCNMSMIQVLSSVNSNGLCVRRGVFLDFMFDEKMGVGNYYGSCEEKQLTLDLLKAGCKVSLSTEHLVIHPVPDVRNISLVRSESYGRGHGRLFANHFNQLFVWRHYIPRLISKLLFSFLVFSVEPMRSRSHMAWVKGFFQGIKRDIR